MDDNQEYTFNELLDLPINELKQIKKKLITEQAKLKEQKIELIGNILYLQNLNKQSVKNGK